VTKISNSYFKISMA